MKLYTIVFTLFSTVGLVNAGTNPPSGETFIDVARLSDICINDKTSGSGILTNMMGCIMYIDAVVDTISTLRGLGVIDNKVAAFCIPEDLTAKELTKTIRDHLIAYSATHQRGHVRVAAAPQVISVLVEKYPCHNGFKK